LVVPVELQVGAAAGTGPDGRSGLGVEGRRAEPGAIELGFRVPTAERMPLAAGHAPPILIHGHTVQVMIRVEQTSVSAEVNLHELGQTIAVAVGEVQRELAHYPAALGAFEPDVEIEIPMQMRVDSLGQLLVTVVADAQATPGVGRLRLAVRPQPHASRLLPTVESVQPLATLHKLELLTDEAVAQLKARRIFTANDLLRVGRSGAGRAGLEALAVGDLSAILQTAQLFVLPFITEELAIALYQEDVRSIPDFVAQDPKTLAERLAKRLGKPVDARMIAYWQRKLRPDQPWAHDKQGDGGPPVGLGVAATASQEEER
jgi:hypothetical protein